MSLEMVLGQALSQQGSDKSACERTHISPRSGSLSPALCVPLSTQSTEVSMDPLQALVTEPALQLKL